MDRSCPPRGLSAAGARVEATLPRTGFTTVIGLEVHAQLQVPDTKLFSRAPGAKAGRALGPNEAVAHFDAV